jgi:electron transfer flavoprotein alpha subunit
LEHIVSTPGTGGGKPRIAARRRLGLTGDVIDLEINAHGQLVQLKPALVGHVMAQILSKTLPHIVTLRPGMLTPIVPDRGASATVEVLAAPAAAKADVTVLEVHHTDEVDAIALTQAQIVTGEMSHRC